MVFTSARNSFLPCPTESKHFTATLVPLPKSPSKTDPNPPRPSLTLKSSVADFNSRNEKRLSPPIT
ncbi:hypothetical protein LguiA_017254 [Lonicera macranthoides]